jgi:hypothetical protein
MAQLTLDGLVSQLRAAYGTALRSVVLYGSAAAGEHIPKRSDYNVLVIVDALTTDSLRAASATARAWAEAGNPAPLTLTASEWRGSVDIFPMEYADMIERHRVLHGESPFTGIAVEPGDLRLQLEQESMGKLIKFRQGILASGGDYGRQLELIAGSVSTIMVIFRALLRLLGQVPPTDNIATSEAVARAAGFDPAPFATAIRHVRGERKIATGDVPTILPAYLRGMEQLVKYLDRYEKP